MAKDSEIDVVMILTADEYHVSTFWSYAEYLCSLRTNPLAPRQAAYAVEAADNGKAVFIEKPMALTHADAQSIIDAEARNKVSPACSANFRFGAEISRPSQVTIFVGYMRRYATAFEVAKKEIQSIKKIDYVRVRDIIGFVSVVCRPTSASQQLIMNGPLRQNHFFVDQSGFFPAKFTDFPAEANEDRLARGEKIAQAALGELTKNPRNTGLYRLLGGLGSHDLSAMRELIGLPKSCFAASRPAAAPFLTALFEYEGFTALYETGIDGEYSFQLHLPSLLTVFTSRCSPVRRSHRSARRGEAHQAHLRHVSDCESFVISPLTRNFFPRPYIKGLPITVTILEADSEGRFQERIIRPTYKVRDMLLSSQSKR